MFALIISIVIAAITQWQLHEIREQSEDRFLRSAATQILGEFHAKSLDDHEARIARLEDLVKNK